MFMSETFCHLQLISCAVAAFVAMIVVGLRNQIRSRRISTIRVQSRSHLATPSCPLSALLTANHVAKTLPLTNLHLITPQKAFFFIFYLFSNKPSWFSEGLEEWREEGGKKEGWTWMIWLIEIGKKVWTKDVGKSEDRPERGRGGRRVLDLWVASREEDEELRGFRWGGEGRGGVQREVEMQHWVVQVAVAMSWKLPKSLQMVGSAITAIIVEEDTERPREWEREWVIEK